MKRPLSTLRFLGSLLVPGGVLVLAAWAIQSEEVVRTAAAPYAMSLCVGALVASVLLSWYYDQSRLLCSASAVILTVLALTHVAARSNLIPLAAVILFPLNLSLLGVLKERGVMAIDGLLKLALVAVQAVALWWITENNGFDLSGIQGETWIAQLSFAIGAITLLALVFNRRTKVEQGLFWALVAMFLGINHAGAAPSGAASDALFFYAGVAGLVLVFAVLEHGYDIAYRDELTGLPGRRAFNNVMEQLGGSYALAMCDVDHFKLFNDAYGHEAGDQVLRMVASKLSHVGGGGRAFRYGGEEFLIVFRGSSASEAEPFVEALRRSIADVGFVLRSPDRPTRKPRAAQETKQSNLNKIRITISIGVAERSKRHSTPELVLDAADAALYSAKEAGRNCVKLDESTPRAFLQPA
jgi:diguanylate cyclase (GGDEF)-like protein